MRPDKLRVLWLEHRGPLMRQWLNEHLHSRPWAWWRFEAPEPRRQLGGRGVLMSQRFHNLAQLYEYGVPLFDSEDADDPPVFETERDYLERLELLAAGGRRRLRPGKRPSI